MVERAVLHFPPGIGIKDFKGYGTSGIVARLNRTVIKFPHAFPECIERCRKEGLIYERFEAADHRPSSLFEYHGKTEQGILLELAERGCVRQYLRESASSPPATLLLQWAQQAAEALVFCHDNDVLHGDINCSNFFLNADLDLKVGDYTSSSFDEPTGSVYSTTHQLPDADFNTHETEIFAFGSGLYEMVIGRAPYDQLEDEKVESLFRQKQFPDVSSAIVLGETISRCWTLQFSSMKDVLQAIKAERMKYVMSFKKQS